MTATTTTATIIEHWTRAVLPLPLYCQAVSIRSGGIRGEDGSKKKRKKERMI